MGTHRIYVEGLPSVGDIVRVEGDEAKHAVRVKRLAPGDAVLLLDGAGSVGEGIIEPRPDTRRGEWILPIRLASLSRVDPVVPALDVLTATPKGTRLDDMIGSLSQVGAATWAPLATDRGVVDPREAKMGRIQRLAVEASKQCGRAWLMRTGQKTAFRDALAWGDGPVIVADAGGEPYTPTGAARIRLLIGPEGGWTGAEREQARRAGARICSFGPHAMRIETAATVTAGVIMAVEFTAGRAANADQPARPPSTPR